MKSQFKNQGYCQSVQVLTQGTPFTTHIHLNAVACERVSELDVYLPYLFSPSFKCSQFCFLLVSSANGLLYAVTGGCQIYR